jgi:predicted RNA polymerase sigma factor
VTPRLRRSERESSMVRSELNRAVAVAELRGPRAALKLVEDLQLDNYYAFHAKCHPS